MKKTGLLLCSLISLAVSAQMVTQVKEPAEWVNPLMGTDSKPDLSNGNTYPAIALPWGMNFWTPQTGRMGDGWAYTYKADKINGFKQTHQPSPWMNDHGQFAVMPITGALKFEQASRASWFSHKAETVKPYYYSVYLADYDVTTEITPTERAARFRFTFPKTDSAYVVVDAFNKGSYIKIIPAEKKIIGYTTRNSGGVTENFKNYFVIYFDKPFTVGHAWHGNLLAKDTLEYTADHTGAIVQFKTARNEQVNMSVASSFISFDQAEISLKREIGNKSFDQLLKQAKDTWNSTLGKIMVEGGTIDQVRTFYSCLYRALFFPQKMYEIDANGKPIHYSPYNGKTLPGYLFSGTGFWDTFRALYPFLNLVYPDINREMQEGLVNAYKEGGFLPEWSSPGYRNVMIGNNSAAIVADAYIKGLRGYDINTLYEAVIKDANTEGPLTAVGRKGVSFYNRLGYVPYDVDINESAARTLEYAFDDFTIAKLGEALKRPKQEIDLYLKRSQNYRNLFDAQTKLMRGKNKDGEFQSPYNPFKWGDAFTEGNGWHYTWSVFHDIEGLKKLMGGNAQFAAMLDSVFIMPPVFDESYYGGVIHEIREMQIMNMGQYAHGNQPIQHMIYLYNYAGQPWKSQYWIRRVMEQLYKPTPDGYCGDEDNGQTSAWYIFSAMGFYPVCPATDQYVLGTPLFKKMTILLANGKKLIINAPASSDANKYVQSLKWNGQSVPANWIAHSALVKGGAMDWSMGAAPNTRRGTSTADFPYSFSNEYPSIANNFRVTAVDKRRNDWKWIDEESIVSKDSTTKNGYTLIFLNLSAGFSDKTKQRMTDAFFEVYPKEAQRFNPGTLKKVHFIVDPGFSGVAATSGDIIRFNPKWLSDHPEDIDVVTHEAMHIVQNYGSGGGPGWLTEGIADYVRYVYGVNNTAGKWSLPEFSEKQNYKNSYRITARFLVWLEKNVSPTIVNDLDAAMRQHTYTPEIWKTLAHKTLDELWADYAKNPAI